VAATPASVPEAARPSGAAPGRHAALVGPTAAGKSAVALEIARRRGDVEIVTADSMQVYRGMDIGTAKPTPVERVEVPHHLLDIVDPDEEYAVARFGRDVRRVLAEIESRGHRGLIVGGTGLYVRAAVDDLDVPPQFDDVRAELDLEPDTAALHRRLVELDPVAGSRMEPTNRRRVVRALEVCLGSGRPFSSFGPGLERYDPTPIRLLGLTRPRRDLDERVTARYDQQLADGFLDEVRRLRDRPAGLSRTAHQALGYRELLDHLDGAATLDEAVDTAITRTRRFARRQLRWFRRDPRISWLLVSPDEDPAGADAPAAPTVATMDTAVDHLLAAWP
jgi:tRNA dimethylallyltransferase